MSGSVAELQVKSQSVLRLGGSQGALLQSVCAAAGTLWTVALEREYLPSKQGGNPKPNLQKI